MPHTRFPMLQRTLASRTLQTAPAAPALAHLQPHVNQQTFQAITAYAAAMAASVDNYKRDVDALFAAHCAQTSALIAMQHQYIASRDALHEQQMRDLTSSFHVRYQHLEAELTAGHVYAFRDHIADAQSGLDFYDEGLVPVLLHDMRLTMHPDPADTSPVLTPRSQLLHINELLDLHGQFEAN